MDRSLGLSNAMNARDFGGLPTVDGRRVRRGVLFRSNAFNRLTDADLAMVGQLRLACLIDFRHQLEIEIVGADRLPTVPPGQVISMPLFDPEHDIFTTVSASARGMSGPEALARLHPDHDSGGAVAAMRELYRWFVTSDSARETFAAALRLIAQPESLPLLFHCTAGKDRTGWLSALVLSALGVPRDVIVEDYLHTNDRNAGAVSVILSGLAGKVPDPSIVLPLLQARREYLEESFAEVERGYGDMIAYLRTGLDLDAAVLGAIRTNLLE